MAKRKPRKLSDEDQALWRLVAEKTKPLHAAKSALAEQTQSRNPKTKAKVNPPAAPDPLPRFQIGQKPSKPSTSYSMTPDIQDQLRRGPVGMDRNTYTRMSRGKLSPEARIDLHGMTLSRAHPALIGFIMRASADGKRLVLVITGKGKSKPDDGPIPQRLGVLRHQVPQWLSSAPLSGMVLQVTPAHQKHGGHGAYYVYLRRNR